MKVTTKYCISDYVYTHYLLKHVTILPGDKTFNYSVNTSLQVTPKARMQKNSKCRQKKACEKPGDCFDYQTTVSWPELLIITICIVQEQCYKIFPALKWKTSADGLRTRGRGKRRNSPYTLEGNTCTKKVSVSF